MQIVQSLESISVNTDDLNLFQYLKDLITRNFTKVLGRKDKIFSFFEENEIPQRKYFLKLLEKKYKDTNDTDIKELSSSYYKTFRLNLKLENTLKAVLALDVEFGDCAIMFKFKNKDRLFISYVKQYFKDHSVEYSEKNNILFIKHKNELTFSLFESFASVSEHLKYTVDFNIDSKKYDDFKKNAKNKENSQWKFNALAKLFSSYFQTLDCKPSDDLQTIRQHYLILVKLYHPDFHHGKSSEEKAYCREQFEKIQIAYDNLKALYKNNA
ncbi:adenylosuccinate lyase [uncultured Campylobacter sp.]|uniref:adenylosuccinate lyase n=1 Tax=uncultured Campylobacter sp. TaxID=218934 RepID=UPI00260A8688|nr:adenylosuccinate lyase [uncultured Campylobacter sp.]